MLPLVVFKYYMNPTACPLTAGARGGGLLVQTPATQSVEKEDTENG